MSNKHIVEVINELKDDSKLIVLKLPSNFDFPVFYKRLSYTKKIHFYKFKHFVVVVLLNRSPENSNINDFELKKI